MATESDIMFYAFRYALGRHTYAVADVARYIIAQRSKLTEKDRALIVKEIEEYNAKWAGEWECDTREWNAVVRALTNPSHPHE